MAKALNERVSSKNPILKDGVKKDALTIPMLQHGGEEQKETQQGL